MPTHTAPPKERRRLKNSEIALIVVTILFLVLLIAKSLYFDGYERQAGHDAALLAHVRRHITLSEGLVSERIVAITVKEQTLSVRTRRYLLSVFPIGDQFWEVIKP